MKTLLFCTSFIADESAWQQHYQRWLQHHQSGVLKADAIVMIDDHSPYQPAWLAVLPASRIGRDLLPSESMLRFGQRLGGTNPSNCPGWWRSMLASVSLALHYGFERIILVEPDCSILSKRLTEYLASRTSGWTALWCSELNHPETAIQVLCRDAFHLVEQLAARGPFAFRDQPAVLNLPFTSVEKNFIGTRYHQLNHPVPANADYAVARLLVTAPGAFAPSNKTALAMLPPVEIARGGEHDAEAACSHGMAAYQNGNFAEARAALERSDWLQPEQGMTCKFLGAARMQQGELAGAMFAATQAARLLLADAVSQNMAGAFCLQAKQPLEAIGYFRAALALEPEGSVALSNLARIDWTEPEVLLQFPGGLHSMELEVRSALMERLRVARLTTSGAAALLAFGVHFPKDFDLLVQLARVVMTDPENNAQTLFAAGNALIVSGDHARALLAYQRAALLAPQSDRIKGALGYASICQGEDLFSGGFRIANEAWPRINPAAFAANPRRWRGNNDTSSKLLVYQEQGIGDALICLRMLPLINQASIQARLWLRPELAALVSDQTGVPLLLADERPDAVQLGFDSVSPLFGLIDALHITADLIPAPLLIKAPAASVAHFAAQLKALKRLRVGLCLFGNPSRADDWARSVPDSDLSVLAELQQVDWINLSVDARPERASLKRLLPQLTDLAGEMSDFQATAALIANLDVVISIDSVIAHLAASLGKPVLLIRPAIADWRWQIGEVQSPWWPTVEVFAADQPGDFSSAMSAVAARIKALAAEQR